MERPVEFRALGSIELRVSGVEALDVIAQPKRLSLFAFLALGPHRSCRRDTLVALLWPERDESRARHALRQSLYYLRSHLDESLFVIRGEEIAIDDTRLWCDVDELDRAWARGDLERVGELYRGTLLEGFHTSASACRSAPERRRASWPNPPLRGAMSTRPSGGPRRGARPSRPTKARCWR